MKLAESDKRVTPETTIAELAVILGQFGATKTLVRLERGYQVVVQIASDLPDHVKTVGHDLASALDEAIAGQRRLMAEAAEQGGDR
jgi:hypothetical protein